MPQPICPYLGLKQDPNTVLEFPSERNYCHHARPVAPVNLRHQRLTCLTDRYVNCPVYQQSNPQTLPENLTLPSFQRARQRRTMLVLFFLLALGGLAVGILGTMNATEKREEVSQSRSLLGNAGGTQDLLLLTQALNLTERAVSTSITTTLGPEQPTGCVPPEGWIEYQVKPTDSLLRLSLLYRTSIEALQIANCLGDRTLIQPGQTLFVPPLPTPTATPTHTPTRTRVPSSIGMPTSPPQSGNNPSPPTATSTFIFPTSTPQPTATPIPPTATPLPTSTRTLPPPPTQPTPTPFVPPTPTLPNTPEPTYTSEAPSVTP